MGLVERIGDRSGVRRAESVSTAEFANLLLGRGSSKSSSGVSVGPERALGIAAWYSGVRYLSETVASLPCFSYRDTLANGRQKRADPPWRRSPDPDLTWMGWTEFQVMSLLHRGNGFSYKVRDPLGRVTGLRPIHPDRVRIGRMDGRKGFRIDGNEDVYFTRDILHVPGLSYDGLGGLDPIQYASDSLGITAAADEYAARYFSGGSHIDSYVQAPDAITLDKALETKQSLQVFHQGLRNAHELAVLGGGWEYKTLALNPKQTQLLESRAYGVLEVARILRIPPHKLYEMTHATFSNIEHQSIEAVTDSIRPWVVRIESSVNADLDLMPAGNFIEFAVEGLLRGDLKSRYEAYQAGVYAGFLTRNEPRRLENLPAIDGLDEPLVPVNMQPLSMSLAPPPPPPAPEPVVPAPEPDRSIHVHVATPDTNVTVHPSDVRVEAPNVTVEGTTVRLQPNITVEAPDITVQAPDVPAARSVRKTITRDSDGEMTSIIEEELTEEPA